MKSVQTLSGISAIAVLTIAAGCSSWSLDRMGQSNRNTTVGAASSTSTSHDRTNSAGADTSGQVALGAQPGSTNPPSTPADAQSTPSGRSYSTQPYVGGTPPSSGMSARPGASTAETNAGTRAAGSGTSTPKMAESSAQASSQQSASANPSSSHMGTSSPFATATPGTASDEESVVRSAQQALNAQGYSAGTVDGIMGPHTQAAIKKFQSAKGLTATGRLDAATMAALGVTEPYSSSTTGMNTNTPERVSASTSTTPSTN